MKSYHNVQKKSKAYARSNKKKITKKIWGHEIDIPYVLSKFDEYVPFDYIPLYKLLVDDELTKPYFNTDKAINLRKQMFNVTEDLRSKYGTAKFHLFWNEYVEHMCILKLFELSRYPFIEHLCPHICAFVEETVGGFSWERQHEISLGVSKEKYAEFMAAYERSKATGEDIMPLDYKMEIKPAQKGIALFGLAKIYITEGEGVNVPNDQLFRRFRDWTKVNKLSQGVAIRMAIELLFEKYPSDALPPLSEYEIKTVFDDLEFPEVKTSKTIKRYNACIPREDWERSQTIIRRYNNDKTNRDKDRMSLSDYICTALRLLNSKMPLKYTSPSTYKELQEIKQAVDAMNGGD